MQVGRTHRDPTRRYGSNGSAPTHVNIATHWWDASQVYGSDAGTQAKLRTGEGGKLITDPDGLLPVNPRSGIDITGTPEADNWWLGLSLMHTLFTWEHNAICDRLHREYPSWSDNDLFEHARLVNAALMAKIHTVEWTPAVINHPTMVSAMRGNWWGVLEEGIYKVFGRVSDSEVLSGIPGSPTDHHSAPYAMTEEFVSVYRMHPLLPDDYSFRSHRNDELLQERDFFGIVYDRARETLHEVPMADIMYSFGTSHPGAIMLHNYPRALQNLKKEDGTPIDLGTIDILRDRERGVPRYNEFRRLFHRKPVRTFEELTDKPQWAEEIRDTYDNDIEKVDLMVGLYAEPPTRGFAFSDTAFRVFALMASRRLKSDRFFTTDYRPEVYSRAGLEWIDNNDMRSVLLRHIPALGPAMHGVKNAFAPWQRA
jgi:hypothetical protein